MEDKLEMFLIELLEKEMFEFLEPYMEAGEGCPANTLIGSPAREILDFLEKRGMTPPYSENHNKSSMQIARGDNINYWEKEEGPEIKGRMVTRTDWESE